MSESKKRASRPIKRETVEEPALGDEVGQDMDYEENKHSRRALKGVSGFFIWKDPKEFN